MASLASCADRKLLSKNHNVPSIQHNSLHALANPVKSKPKTVPIVHVLADVHDANNSHQNCRNQ